jgi:hypothetical protein
VDFFSRHPDPTSGLPSSPPPRLLQLLPLLGSSTDIGTPIVLAMRQQRTATR